MKDLEPISLSVVNLGHHDTVPVVVRHNSISILKRNSQFTSYSQYVNKNVVDIQLSYEKSQKKCCMTVVKKLFKNKSKRELSLACISLFKSIYSEFIVRMEKKREEGVSFPNTLYDIPSQTIKFDLLKLLRSQLSMHGADIFQQCLKIIREFYEVVVKNMSRSHRAVKNSNIIIDLKSFFTELASNTIRSEIKGFYELIRDTLWFATWMIENNLDTKDSGLTARMASNSFSRDGMDPLQMNLEFYRDNTNNDRNELKSYDSLVRSLLSMKICTHSLLNNQENLNEHLKLTTFSKSDLCKNAGLSNLMPYFIVNYYESVLSTRLSSLSEMESITTEILSNFLEIGMFSVSDLGPTEIPLLLQQLISMKEYHIAEKAVECIKPKNASLYFVLAM